MLGLLIGAAVLGTIITIMEDGEFPGWWPLLGCVFVSSLPGIILRFTGAPSLTYLLLAILASAVLAWLAIAGLCEMTFKRAAIAAGIYFGLQICLGLALAMLL